MVSGYHKISPWNAAMGQTSPWGKSAHGQQDRKNLMLFFFPTSG
jgi:hypothetical protein